ncbi:MAG: hypothetical protein H6858_04710 [Rhodospirillales bacterium]|nr:hypothetical protein [Alphaproteobacteria bacterium]MCB9976887.1 hypothetical protein [Rhodospirillales bacterium]
MQIIYRDIALERDPYEVLGITARYHPLKDKEPYKCERAYLEFLGLYHQMKRSPFYLL